MPYHIKKGSVLGSAVPTDGQEPDQTHWQIKGQGLVLADIKGW